MTFSRKTLAALALCAPLASFAAPASSNLDPLFALTPDANVYESTSVKHVTVQGTLSGGNDVAWYSFSAQAGQQLFTDHDDGINGDTLIDSVLSLFDASGRLLAMADDGDLDLGSIDNGGGGTSNAFLGVYTLPTSGMYYLALSSFGNGGDDTGCSVDGVLQQPGSGGYGGMSYTGCSVNFSLANNGSLDGSFTLHVSLTAVPEPGSLSLAGLALAGMMVRRRRR